MNPEESKIIDLVMYCIHQFNESEQYLLSHSLCERAMMFRFGHYLQIKIDETYGDGEYFVDCEFNKNGFEGNEGMTKKLSNPHRNGNNVSLDLIVHKRNSNIKGNLICIEFKHKNTNAVDIDGDYSRLKDLTNQGGVRIGNENYLYAYKLGFFIQFGGDEVERPKIFKDGQEIIIR